MSAPLQAPFPWFGGKSRAAPLIWERLGNVPNYVEPFAGSLAVLLGRPSPSGIETINDLDGYVCNAWRAIALAPAEVARWADWPVSECDLNARHVWLRAREAELAERLMADPDYYDAQIAGWWVWGLCLWIGSGWCGPGGAGPWGVINGRLSRLALSPGVTRKRPHLSRSGPGIIVDAPESLYDWFVQLASRLRKVRVCCGDWTRIMGPSVLLEPGVPCGVLLDPPYSADALRYNNIYAKESTTVAHDVRKWCLDHGSDTRLRIVLCGYEGEGHEALAHAGWNCVEWKAAGGYGATRKEGRNANAERERLWFSPGCLGPEQPTLF